MPEDYSFKLRILAKALREDRCLIFLGSGASRSDSDDGSGLPNASDLGARMAHECELDFPPYLPLSTIAFYFEFFFNRTYLNDFVRDQLNHGRHAVPHTLKNVAEIVRLLEEKGKNCFVVTTNYDQLFEKAYQDATGRKAYVVTYRGGWDPHDRAARLHSGLNIEAEFWRPSAGTTLYKMHGCLGDLEDPAARKKPALVITEDDYINFLTNALSQDHERSLLQHVRGLIALSNILFIGYSLADPNFRVIFKATAEAKKNDSYAVQFFDEKSDGTTPLDKTRWDSTCEFWREKNVHIVNARASEFTANLLRELRKSVRP